MILKYQTLDGAWRVIDGVTEVVNHGFRPEPEISKLAHMYDGADTVLYYASLPVVTDDERNMALDEWLAMSSSPSPTAGPASLYLVVSRRDRSREHMIISDIQQGFLMSDDGKTVDRLLH